MGRKRKSLDLAELNMAKIKHRDEMRKSRGTCENVDIFGIIERQEEFAKKQNERTVVRLEKAKVRTTSARAAESSPARRARLQKKKDRSASGRAAESSPAHRARLQKGKSRAASARATESSPAHRARLQKDKSRAASARATESSPVHRARLQKHKSRAASARATESSPAHRARLQKDKSRAASARATESSPAHRARLQKDKSRAASARATESSPAHRARLQKDKSRAASVRAAESSPAHRARLQKDKSRAASVRAAESSPARRARMQEKKDRSASARATESSPAHRARLQKEKSRAASARATESSPARRARLQEKKDRAVSARAAESSPAHRVRLQRMKKSAIVSRRSLNVTAGLQELKKGVFSGLASPAQFLNAGRSYESATIARRSSKRTTSFEGSANANQNIDINPPPAKLRKVTAPTAGHAKKRRKSNRVARGGVKQVAAPRADTGSGSMVIDDHAGVVADIPVDAVEDHWDDDFDLLTAEFDPADAAVSFCTQMFQLKSHFCPNCRERFPDIKIDLKTLICQKCKRHGKHKFSVGNNMIPGDVPQELENLTIMEQLLISPRLPTFSVYRRPMGQYSYSGNVITFPQDVETLVDVLPRVSSDLHMLVLRKQGKGGTFKDERVRRNVVEKALNWLCEHNTWFKDNIRLDRARIDSLPEDGTIDLAEIDEPVVDEEAESSDCEGDMPISQDESSQNDEPNLELIAEPEVPDGSDGNNFVTAESTFVPGASIQVRLESEMKQETVGAMLYGADAEPIPWPALDVSNPVNEFDTVGFLTTSFPHLFPYGRADLHESARNGAAVSELEYFRHLIRFDDGRFSKDPRFRYVALNIILRHRAMASGRVFVKNNSDLSKLTIEDLKSMGRADKSELMKSISRYGQSLSGTKQYWGARRQELLAMIRQKGQLPTFFFTLSAADLQWPDLHRLMPGYTSKTTAVIENPLLCCWFFIERVKVLLNTVFKHDLQCEDYWGRFEFQARGSIHFHGLAWMKDAPDVTKIDTETDQEILHNYVEYFDQFVSAVNPAFDESGVGAAPNIRINPASIPYLKVQPTIDKQKLDRIGLVVYCHTHACRLGYCQRVVNGKKTCRFKFPFELQPESKINVSVDEKTGAKTVDFLINRNDPIMCPLNWRVAQVHRANTNFQPIVCKRHLIGYCTKYVCKSEIQSQMMKLLTEAALTVTNPTDPVRQIAQKTLNLIVGGRDYTAQETMLVLMGMPQYLSSRSFVPLFLSGKSELTVEDGVPVIVSSAVEKYANLRPTGLEEISLTDFYIHHFFRQDGTVGVHRNDKSAIVVPKAVRRVGVDSPLYEEYARDTLMLKKPFRSIKNDLLGPYESFAESLAAFEGQSLPDEFDLNEDVQERENAPTEQAEEPEVERVNSHSCRVPAEFAHLMQSDVAFEMGVNQATDCDWSESYRRNEEYQQVRGFFEKVADFNDDVNNGDVDDSYMNEKQREVYSEVESHMLTAATNKTPLLKIVTGTAGTGKSYLISCLKKLLGKKLLIIAPTGVAAWNVRGRTVNAALRIPVVSTKNFTELQGPALEELQDGLKEVEYIIVEEMSMVGLSKLAMIDSRLRQAFPPCSGQAFGGRSVVLVGDFGQLPPPGDSRMFVRKPRNQFQMAGAFAYRSFKSCTVLDTVVRQEGDAIFRGMLQRLRVGRFTKDDYGILKQRFAGTVRSTDFQNATHLFTKRVDVNQHNICKLGVLKEPIALINSVNTGGAVAEKATSDDAGGLDTFQMLAKGAKIMLTSNVNIDMGLCNGCVGTVVDIVYRDNEGPPGLPLFVLCDFPSYTGPAFVASRPTLFPVAPVTRRFSKSGVSATRTMIPLCLAWAITVHKSQGLTLDRMVLDLGRTEFATGLAFVALSRVRRLEDVMLRPFRFERLANIGGTAKSAVSMQLLRAEDDRLKRMSEMMLESESELSYGSRPVSALSQVRSLLSSLENTPEVRVGTLVQDSVHADEPTAVNEQIPFRPLTALDRERMCQRLRINYHAESRGPVYGADKDISVFLAPTDSGLENVFGDGNCFYYALCLAVSNSRNDQNFNQRVFRNCMAAYIKNHGGEFGWDDGFLNETLEDTEKNYAYAGEGQFVVAAGVLGCSIYIYGNYSSDGFSWKGYHPTQERKTTDRSVYLFHCTLDQRPSADANHFVLVTSV